ncbi:hypothetical protein DICPUDRAFT_78558 [Dictyostelium purpureum]|uniref:Uncharacterized protein n=1 Tax=Dictyostelium purpureum TaxID=5786 RepID=F0ZJX0_DICPU|nr:uncharacterized protein DICPUDRAFT_78558 [Dictyostelium purpureum]EGC35757.1 hypothetical protein DICPUDRAFT_78558 [Dictyostelium purpureum]|eukprot:XP_003287709.1 hypothetical protein DICPUDRAFT_78558 [Dictyostelium purpureum]
MTRKIKIKSIKQPSFSKKDFIGFPKTYPKQLYGIVPVKEYLQAIDYLNSNTRREYDSSVLKYILFYIICGLIPGLIAYIIELRKSTQYKNNFEKDLKFSLEQINKSFFDRRITVSYKLEKTLFVRRMRVLLKIKIPDDGTLEIPISKKTLSPEGKEIIVLETNNQTRDIEYQRSHKYKRDPIDLGFTFIKVGYKKSKDQDFDNFIGFESTYHCELFNYLTETEFINLINDINVEVSRIKINSVVSKLYRLVIILSFFIFGLFFIIPATIIYNNFRIIYFNRLYREIEKKTREYTTQFSSRGISISYQVYSRGWNAQTTLIDLIIYFPKDIANTPTLTRLDNENGSLVVEPMVENCIAPIFMNQEMCIKNYDIYSSAPMLPCLNV